MSERSKHSSACKEQINDKDKNQKDAPSKENPEVSLNPSEKTPTKEKNPEEAKNVDKSDEKPLCSSDEKKRDLKQRAKEGKVD